MDGNGTPFRAALVAASSICFAIAKQVYEYVDEFCGRGGGPNWCDNYPNWFELFTKLLIIKKRAQSLCITCKHSTDKVYELNRDAPLPCKSWWTDGARLFCGGTISRILGFLNNGRATLIPPVKQSFSIPINKFRSGPVPDIIRWISSSTVIWPRVKAMRKCRKITSNTT